VLKIDLGGVGQNGLWITVNRDTSGLRLVADICADITASADQLGEYFDPQSVDEMRCVHTLEHLPFMEIVPSLKYWRTFLKPAGKLLIVVPDMGAIATQYADGAIPFDVMAALAYGDTPGYQRSQNPGELHRWGFDADTLKRDLETAGYLDVQLAGDEHWPATWLFDYPAYAYTGLVGRWSVPNLRLLAVAP
jgi:hypothetical protein